MSSHLHTQHILGVLLSGERNNPMVCGNMQGVRMFEVREEETVRVSSNAGLCCGSEGTLLLIHGREKRFVLMVARDDFLKPNTNKQPRFI